MTEHELATKAINDMDIGEVCTYAAEQLANFYCENPADFATELSALEE